MTPEIYMESVRFPEGNEVGHIWFITERPEEVEYCMPIRVPFSRTGESTPSNPLVWKWDGNREFPSITPSIRTKGYGKYEHILVHFFYTKGKIVLCSDSNIKVKDDSSGI